jgi:hypothetical protein
MKNFIVVFLFVAADIFAVDAQFAKIVNTTTSDLKTRNTLSSLKGHVAINVSSGNSDLDKQFAAAILETFPNFTAASGEVYSDDLYQMAVRVFRNNDNTVSVTVTVTNYQDKKIIDIRVPIGTVDNRVLATIHYENALTARNEFDAYLDSAFADAGPPQNANHTPKEPYDWSWLTNFFDNSWRNITAGFTLKGWGAYVANYDYSFTDGKMGVDALSGGLIFDNDIRISTSLVRISMADSVTLCYFPIDISWNFLKIWDIRFAAYDRLELFSFMLTETESEWTTGTESTDMEWVPNNYIGLRLQWGLYNGDDMWGGLFLGLFTETNLKTFSLGISLGLLGGELYNK